jgi:RNA polymerase sigma factor (sigma-70 family)
MARAATPSILPYLRAISAKDGLKDVPDGALLERFASAHDDATFAVIVRRHGGMVLQLCRTLLGNYADADDAFQATFLVLARRAGSIRKNSSLASWLYGVAYRTALKARAANARRKNQEAHAGARPSTGPVDELTWREAQWIIHQELARLPEKYRAPLVLCYLQGKRHEDAERLLAWPRGKLRSMLERARQRLRQRLLLRGLGGSALLMASVGLGQTLSAAPAGVQVAKAVGAAASFATGQPAAGAVSAKVAALAQHVLQSMTTSKVSLTLGALLAVAALGIGIGQGADRGGTHDLSSTTQVTPAARVPRAPAKGWHARSNKASFNSAPTRKANVGVRASGSWYRHTPDRALDGLAGTMWNAGDYAPQWIEADLGSATQLATLALHMTQLPAGQTKHEIWISSTPIGEDLRAAKLAHTFSGHTDDNQWLKLAFPRGLVAQYVQIRTTESPSWVAWVEVELRVQRPDGRYLCRCEKHDGPKQLADPKQDIARCGSQRPSYPHVVMVPRLFDGPYDKTLACPPRGLQLAPGTNLFPTLVHKEE